MANRKIGAAGLAALGALTLFTTAACSGGTTAGPGGGAAAGGKALTVRGCTPQNELVPGNTAETCGGNIIDATTAKLVHYKAEDASPENDIADKIETTDSKVFTVTLKKGQKFSDGTEIKAKNFVDAWNYTAAAKNGQEGSYFYEPIKGYRDVTCTGKAEDPCTDGPAKTDKLAGLTVVDDYTFKIETEAVTSNLPIRLGYSAFAPMPDSFFAAADKKAWAKTPVGSGPYKVTSVGENEIVLDRNEHYAGAYKGAADKLTFKIYNEMGPAYQDTVANNLDLLDQVPSDQLTNDLWKTDLKGRQADRTIGSLGYLGFSPIDENFKKPEIRKALSMAIDRETLLKQVFAGARQPAKGWVPPVIDGAKDGACTTCTFNAAEAKKMYDAAGGYKGTLTIWYNQDGGHKQWVDAVCNQLKTNLGVDCVGQATPKFKGVLDALEKKELKGLFRLGWQMDYPNIENFLTPIYAKGASSNYSHYDNPAFEAKLKAAAAAKDTESANKIYQEAEAILGQDQASIPIWYAQTQYGWSDKVVEAKQTTFGTWDFSSIKLK